MNIDKTMSDIAAKIPNVQLMLYQTTMEDHHMEAVRVRRKVQGATHHQLWAISATYPDQNGNPTSTIFYDHTPAKAIKKCQAWLQIPTVTRGPRAAKNGQPTAAA